VSRAVSSAQSSIIDQESYEAGPPRATARRSEPDARSVCDLFRFPRSTGWASGRREMKQARGARGAIETVLGLISRPALLIDRGGRIRLANLPGARLLGSNRAHIQGALQLAARGDRSARAWRLTPVGGAPRTSGFIAVLD